MYKYAKHTCSVAFRGGTIRLVEGEAWEAGDPFVKARPDMFADHPTIVRTSDGAKRVEAPVETATRAPGEKRKYTRRTP